ncbi:SDR family oxidoreductase [Corynebacterium tuberculostearicum]|uniref:SDR family oxidoreductase n=1 Tax=Corynebacterium tuberculostearicum TaxID=38304 RepID=UPI0038D13D93
MAGVLILGGRSDIGGEIARRVAPGQDIVLAARGTHGMEGVEGRLRAAGARSVHLLDFDAADFPSHTGVVDRAIELAGPLELAVVAFGILGDQQRAERDASHAVDIATIDYAAQISLLTLVSQRMDRGHIIAFSSIAGWRARRANYVYGSTKAGLDAFCQGLADKLHGSQVGLITARPGFVIGSMTEGMKPAPLSVRPADVAEAVVGCIDRDARRGKPRSRTVWIPRALQGLAWVMRLVPRPIWRHMPR